MCTKVFLKFVESSCAIPITCPKGKKPTQIRHCMWKALAPKFGSYIWVTHGSISQNKQCQPNPKNLHTWSIVISRLSTHFQPEPLVHTLLISLSGPSNSMNCNGKQTKPEQPAWPNSSVSRHLLNMKVPPTSRALKLYTTLSSNCFALVFKRKPDWCVMDCDDCLRRFSKTLTNWHWMSSVKKFLHSRQTTLHDMLK